MKYGTLILKPESVFVVNILPFSLTGQFVPIQIQHEYFILNNNSVYLNPLEPEIVTFI